jgi:gas vesicle protein
MGRDKSSNAKTMAIGAAIAAVAGYITGVLTAPKSGKETRDDIKNTANKGLTEAERELKKLHTELNELITDVKEKGGDLSDKTSKELRAVVEKAKAAKEKTRDVLSAIHEGDAEDKDLQKAISEANKSLEHLRSYLKK